MAFGVLALCQLFHAFNMRHNTKSVFSMGLFTNPWMVGAFAVCVLLQLSVMLIPALQVPFKIGHLSGPDWLLVALLSVSPLFIYEIEKIFVRRYDRRHGIDF